MPDTELNEGKLQKLLSDFMKDRNKDAVSALKMIKTKIATEKGRRKNVEELPGDEVAALVKREIKEIRETMDSLEKIGAQERLKEEENKLQVLEALLPPSLTDEELDKIISEVIREVGGDNFGKVMKTVMSNVQGRADGKVVSARVREMLS